MPGIALVSDGGRVRFEVGYFTDRPVTVFDRVHSLIVAHVLDKRDMPKTSLDWSLFSEAGRHEVLLHGIYLARGSEVIAQRKGYQSGRTWGNSALADHIFRDLERHHV